MHGDQVCLFWGEDGCRDIRLRKTMLTGSKGFCPAGGGKLSCPFFTLTAIWPKPGEPGILRTIVVNGFLDHPRVFAST